MWHLSSWKVQHALSFSKKLDSTVFLLLKKENLPFPRDFSILFSSLVPLCQTTVSVSEVLSYVLLSGRSFMGLHSS